jgi:hypothetical protein
MVRILLIIPLLYGVVERWPVARELYTTDGAPAPIWENYDYPGFLPIPGPFAGISLYTVMMVALFTSLIGWRTRLSLWIATPLYVYFVSLDSLSTLTKYNVIGSHMLMLLAVSRCGAIWSVDAWLAGVKWLPLDRADLRSDLRFPVWPARMFQLLLGIIYFGAAITKMHTPAFFSGDQLMYWMITYLNNDHWLGDRLSQYPLVLVVFGYITIVWEVVFLFTVWRKWSRLPALITGLLFHVMTIFTLGLYIFPAVMCSSYLAFVTEEDMQWFFAKVRRVYRRLGMARLAAAAWLPAISAPRSWIAWNAPAYGAMLVVAAGAGLWLEHRLDCYQVNNPDRMLELQPLSASRELDEQDVRMAISGRSRILREKDKLFAFDLGTIIAGEHLIDHRDEFRQGEPIIAQASFNPPHADAWLECSLHRVRPPGEDSDEETVEERAQWRIGGILPRENFRYFFRTRCSCSFRPGEYCMILKSAGQEVGRRRFRLLPGPNGLPADDTSTISAN